ncbi:MAG TPA: large conductance mechanosensitive channel protein MscL [Vicinamibacterales bacterium]|nr:large conductance mechanosensitive channel protein MscL [Vicinamibacterales bacterium]
MYREFREFLLKQNALALAVGVITGAALGRVVTSVVSDLLMPVISMGMPSGDWRAAKVVLSRTIGPDGKEVVNSINYGNFAGTVVDFVIVSFAVFLILRRFLKPTPADPTKACPFCLETVPEGAKRCRACTSAL